MTTGALAIAAASASTTGDDAYDVAAGADACVFDGGTNEYDVRATGTWTRWRFFGTVVCASLRVVLGTGLILGRAGAAWSFGAVSGGNHGSGTDKAGSVDGGAGSTSALTVGIT